MSNHSPRSLPDLVGSLIGADKRATLHLRSGRDVSGRVVEVVAGRTDEVVVIVRDEGTTYVPISTIEAVTVDGPAI